MEVQARRLRAVQDRDNIDGIKPRAAGKAVVIDRRGLQSRGAFGDVGNKLPSQPSNQVNKIASTVAEFEKKATISKNSRSYKHVSSKIDTGLPKPPANHTAQAAPVKNSTLKREESTAGHALRAAVLQKNKIDEANKIPLTVNEKASSRNLKKSDSKENIPEGVVTEQKKPREKRSSAVKLLRSNSAEDNAKVSELDKFCPPPLPSDIEDIDADDKNSPVLLSIYIKDIYSYLKYMEAKYEVKPDFLEGQDVINGNMRSTLINWLVEVHTQFSLQHETLQLTIAIIDRYLQSVKTVGRKEFQLVGVTAMFIASKYEEIFIPDISDFVYITDNSYNKKEILSCEKAMIKKLDFSLGRPLPLHFLRRFVKAAHGSARNHHLAKYLVDLALLEASLAPCAPSLLAAAGLALSLFLLGNTDTLDEVWSPTLAYYSGYKFEAIQPIIFKIAKALHEQEKSKWRSISVKYQQSALARVSLLPQLRDPIIEAMALKAK